MQGISELKATLDGADRDTETFAAPKPEAIPARERRRAGLLINLAVQVAHEACENAGVAKNTLPSVFASALSDTAVTDYMCRKLAQPEKMLSPTKFHNSVHNAPSGYWTISSENRAPSSYVAGFEHTVGSGLMEAISQSQAAGSPVLLVCYDIAVSAPFDELLNITESLAVSCIIGRPRDGSPSFTTQLTKRQPATQPGHPFLAARAQANPAGELLQLIESTLVPNAHARLSLPVSNGTSLELEAS